MSHGEATQERVALLRAALEQMGSVAVAFSGGVDSTFLLAVAHEVLGDRTLAITSAGRAIPARDVKEARAFCAEQGIAHEVLTFDELTIPEFAANVPDRCYHCKRALFSRMQEVARARGIDHLVDGSNKDDEGDYRPGMRALAELSVASPLRDADLTKAEIRTLSHEMGLPTWDKPSVACLASRFAYGDAIDAEKLERVGRAEAFLRDQGFDQLRVRVHGTHGELARIEVNVSEIARFSKHILRVRVVKHLQELGFTYVSLDLQGFRSGAMNEVL